MGFWAHELLEKLFLGFFGDAIRGKDLGPGGCLRGFLGPSGALFG